MPDVYILMAGPEGHEWPRMAFLTREEMESFQRDRCDRGFPVGEFSSTQVPLVTTALAEDKS